ncbi:hypothetical protein [Dyella ginsengisoli]|uniref:hypothetical protein n=1 Tax=Dyella ginsengisoli TaxID=363848 RepID=UPI001F529B75|nr:hypothetical protein [Dyella ginsengisoli]
MKAAMTTSHAKTVTPEVWELRSGSVNDYAPLVFAHEEDMESGMFDASGIRLTWPTRPRVEVFVEPGKKKPKSLADVSALTPGALAMNDEAKAALEPFLSAFGQFLAMDCGGQTRWFYNVTNLIPCIDESRSTRRPSGSIVKEAFFEHAVPVEPAVFKDPLTAAASIYVNDAGKAALEKIVAEAAIAGVAFVEPGPLPKKPRPRS